LFIFIKPEVYKPCGLLLLLSKDRKEKFINLVK